MKTPNIVLMCVTALAIFFSVIRGAEQESSKASNPIDNVYEVLRCVEDFNQLLMASPALAEYKISYQGGLAYDSRSPGVWPKGRIGCWKIANHKGDVVANIQIEKKVTHAYRAKVRNCEFAFELTIFDGKNAHLKDKLNAFCDAARDFDIPRVEDDATDEDLRKLEK